MMALTHASFAACVGLTIAAPQYGIALMAGGSLLPDVDYPQSFIGRILFPISIPLHAKFGHRKTIHGFPLWCLVMAIGFFYKPIFYVGLGALTHSLLDCWNFTGVEAMQPFSELKFVLFKKKWRIITGSRIELAIMLVFMMISYSSYHVGVFGGFRALLNEMLGSYQIAYERYAHEGLKKCVMKGDFRYEYGEIKPVIWLIVGKEGLTGLALFDHEKNKLVHVPGDGQFLNARLKVSPVEWKNIKINGIMKTQNKAFMFSASKNRWILCQPDNLVSGHILADNLNLTAEF